MRALGFRLVKDETPVRRDPAPSRWSYRWQRAMLKPLIRRTVRVGLPVFGASLLFGLWALSDQNRSRIAQTVTDIRASIESRPEFQVTGLQVTGAEPALAAAVTGLMPATYPVSSFHIDLDDLRARVVALSAVQDATVAIRPGGVLTVTVTERQPVAVWRYTDGLRLIDPEGQMTGMIAARSDRADLPLIAGDGAKEHIAQALALFAQAEPIADRVHGLVRMGERRWDLVLDREMRVLLPEDNPEAALARLLDWQATETLLDRDVAVVDLRQEGRPVVRLNQSALNVLRTAQAVAAETE